MRGWLNLKDLKGPDWPRFRSSSVTIITTIIIGGITTTIIIITITTIIITKAHKEKGTQADVPFFLPAVLLLNLPLDVVLWPCQPLAYRSLAVFSLTVMVLWLCLLPRAEDADRYHRRPYWSSTSMSCRRRASDGCRGCGARASRALRLLPRPYPKA
jgi:hypothetical protein